LRSSLTELIDESTSMSSIFNCPHPHDLEWDHYRTGFQSRILAPVSESEAFKKTIRHHDHGAHKKPLVGFMRLM
jgi:hypothetical protein